MDDDVADDIVDNHWNNLANALRTGVYDDDLEAVRDAELRRTARDAVLDIIDERMTLQQNNTDANGVEDS